MKIEIFKKDKPTPESQHPVLVCKVCEGRGLMCRQIVAAQERTMYDINGPNQIKLGEVPGGISGCQVFRSIPSGRHF